MKNQPSVSHKPCVKCNGNGFTFHQGFTSLEGRVYPDSSPTCPWCNGEGWFAPLDIPAICAEIKGRKGLRSARPKSSRAYFVWRMARFHGGADVTMPVCAMLEIGGDPFEKQLEIVAEQVAKKVFGTDLAAGYRWSNALGGSIPVPSNMPASAFSCGPVADADKPESEAMELR